MKKQFLVLLVLVFQFAIVQVAYSVDEGVFDYSNLWYAETLGTWKIEEKYGYYRVLVIRNPAREHSQDHVYLQIIERVGEKENLVTKNVEFNTPGYRGYVRNIELVNISELNKMAVHIDIEMKAMGGIIMREIYLVSPDGQIKELVKARYVDIYE